MGDDDDPTDEALLALATRDGEAFGAFYDGRAPPDASRRASPSAGRS
jgi:hypothetical protein